MNLQTNYRDTFIKYQNAERTKPILPPASMNVTNEDNRPFLGKSQTSIDFIRHTGHKPPKPAGCNSYVSDLNDQVLYPGPK